MNDVNSAAVIAAIAGLCGMIVGSLSTLILTYINRRFDDRRQLREIAIKAAFDNFQHDFDYAKLTRQETGLKVTVAPIDSYFIHWLKLVELISDKRITAANVEAELRRIKIISHEAAKSAREQNQ